MLAFFSRFLKMIDGSAIDVVDFQDCLVRTQSRVSRLDSDLEEWDCSLDFRQ